MSDRYIEWHHARATTAIALKGSKKKRRVTDKQRIRSKLYNLSLDISTLKQQIHDLQVHRNLLYTRQLYKRTDSDGSLVRLANEFLVWTWEGGRRSREVFMRVVSEDVAFGAFKGRELFATLHMLHIPWTQTLRSELKSLYIRSPELETESYSVVVSTVSYTPMTYNILKYVFPAVLKYPALTDALLNQPLRFDSTIILEFDNHNQIVRHDTDLDFLGGLSELLGDRIRAAELMEEAVRDRCGVIYNYVKLERDASFRVPRIEEVIKVDEPSPTFRQRQSVEFLLS